MVRDVRQAAAVGVVAACSLVVAALLVPPITGWDVRAHNGPLPDVAPLNGFIDVKLGPGTPLAVLVGIATVTWGPALTARLGWRRLLGTSVLASLAWLLGLALVDGTSGISRVLGNRHEYLDTARSVESVPHLLSTYTDHIALHSPDMWPVHVAGHPPGMVLFFVALVRIGLGGDLAAGLVVTAVASTLPAAVLVTLRALGREDLGRGLAPFLVATPSAVFLAVSADAVIATTIAWGLACLALAGRATARSGWPWAVVAGGLLGYAVMMSYGMPLAGLLALAVLVAARAWWPLPVAAAAALAVAGAFAAGGFLYWDALGPLHNRYWEGIASNRPASYWLWGNLGALVISAGPMVGASLGAAWAARRTDREVTLLVGAATLTVLAASASLMSKAEVERIWLPFMPWLMIGVTLLPERWRRPALAAQVATALVVQHLLNTNW